jgi:hypothetical protein
MSILTLTVGIMVLVNDKNQNNSFYFGSQLTAEGGFAIIFTAIVCVFTIFHLIYQIFKKLDKYTYSNIIFAYFNHKFGKISSYFIYSNAIAILVFLLIGLIKNDNFAAAISVFCIYYSFLIASAILALLYFKNKRKI